MALRCSTPTWLCSDLFRITEAKALQFRLELSTLSTTPSFFGPASVNGDFSNPQLFGKVVKATPPRLIQVA